MGQGRRRLAPGSPLPPLTVRAVNNAVGVGIHDDATAVRYGFRGGLVPGITLFTYLGHALLLALGEEWLQRGQMDVRFRRPVYHGDRVAARGEVAAHDEEKLELAVWVEGDDGLRRAEGSACLPAHVPESPPPPPYVVGAEEAPPLPPLRPGEVPLGIPFRPLPVLLTAEESLAYAREVGVEHPVYGRLVNPGLLLRQTVRRQRVPEGPAGGTPAVHMGYQVHHCGTVETGRPYTFYGQYVDAFASSRGDEFAVSEHALLDADGRVLFQVRLTSIYHLQPRTA